MNDDLTSLLAELRIDHKNMAVMLNILEAEANRIYDGQPIEYELMRDVMHYMTVYPDAVHHPKENRVYMELRVVRPDLANGFDRISKEHRELADLGSRLRDTIESIISGAVQRRSVVVSDAMRYVELLRKHMHWEERDLFLRVGSMIRDGHPIIIESVLQCQKDPVFGPNVEKHFEKLLERIQLTLK